MAKMRSPNFPAIHLSQAIDLTGKIFREDRTNAIEKEDAAKHMGYTGLTGRTLKLLGALSQFGLLEKVAKGQVRVSRTAVSILHPSSDEERAEALGRAGRSPALFKRIRDAFPEDPSERTITSFLIREGFTDSAIPSVLKSYRETNRFLASEGVAESHGKEDAEEAESPSDFEDDDEMTDATPIPAQARSAVERRVEIVEADAPLDFKISSGRLTLIGSTTSPTEAKAFLPKLQAAIQFFAVVASDEVKNGNEDEDDYDL